MKCDMHVHTFHSGMCTVPGMRLICRESYTHPETLYEKLKRQGMDLVTVTDHDSIDAVEPLRKHADFFLSEEVTCELPSGTELHVGVYDITERQHVEIQRRRGDFLSLHAYLTEQDLLFSANHVFSHLTGRRTAEDFERFRRAFPALETRNGCMPEHTNRAAANFADAFGKAPIAGSDAHAVFSLGSCWTEIPRARTKEEFLSYLRQGMGQARGASGNYWKLTPRGSWGLWGIARAGERDGCGNPRPVFDLVCRSGRNCLISKTQMLLDGGNAYQLEVSSGKMHSFTAWRSTARAAKPTSITEPWFTPNAIL